MFSDPQVDDRQIRELRDWIQSRLGIFYSDAKLDILRFRLERLLRMEDVPNLAELHRLVIQVGRTDLHLALAQIVSTNHTHFFREAAVLESLPEAVSSLSKEEGPIRIWCAAVSSGQEAYTLAMMLVDLVGAEEARRRFSILGTDVNQLVLQRAEQGVYSRSDLDSVPETSRARYFQPVGLGQFRVRPEIRQLCLFRRLNLKSSPWPFQNLFHVVVCRNVLYYFDEVEQASVVRRLYEVAHCNGWLLTSCTESIRGLGSPWVSVAPGVHRTGMASTLLSSPSQVSS